MARAIYGCTGCKPVDTSIIEAYLVLINTNESAEIAEGQRVEAENSRVSAESERTRVFNADHGIAQEDHRTAVADHGTAGDDHTTAVADHGIAHDDHILAVADHGTASDDHLAVTGATTRANNAAAAAEHMVDIHQGPPGEDGKSPYIGLNGNWYVWDDTTQQYVDSGERAQGRDGNPGSSLDYPFELVNNEETNDSTKAHTAAGGKRLQDQIRQLEQEVDDKIEELEVQMGEGRPNNYVPGTLLSDGTVDDEGGFLVTDFIPCAYQDSVEWYNGFSQAESNARICFYNASRNYINNASYIANSVPSRTLSAQFSQTAYVRATVSPSNTNVHISINGTKVWERKDAVEGMNIPSLRAMLDAEHEPVKRDNSPLRSAWVNGYYTDNLSNFTTSTTTRSVLISVQGGDILTIAGKTASSNYRIFDGNGDEIKKNGGAYYQSVTNGDFVIPANGAKFQLNCTSTEKIYIIRTALTRTEDYSDNFAVGLSELKNFSLVSGFVNCQTGAFADSTGSQLHTTYIPLKGAKTVTFLAEKPKITNSDAGYCFYDADKNLVESWGFPYDTSQADPGTLEMSVRVPPSAEYFVTSVYTTAKDDFYLKLGYEKIPSVPVIIAGIRNNAPGGPKRFSDCKDFGTQPGADGSASSFCNVLSGDYASLISTVYDPLVSAYPNYVTKHNIGKDASGTYDMFAFVFTPKYYQQTVILTSGVHATEVSSIASLARIMQLVANSDGTDADLDFFRYNVRFVVIPVVNVWGFSQSPKNINNADGAAMQGWNVSPKIQELQNVETFLDDYVGDASFLVDMHTTTSANYPDFYGIINQDAPNVRTILRTAEWLGGHYTGRTRTLTGWEDYVPIGLRKIDNHTLNQYYNNVKNVPASTMELTDYIWDGANTNTQATANIMTMGVTMYLNYFIQQANDVYKIEERIASSEYGQTKG